MRINNIQYNTHTNVAFERKIPIIDMHTHDKPVENLGKGANASDLLRFMQKDIEVDGDSFVVQKMIPTSLESCFYTDGQPYADEIKGNEDVLKTFSGSKIDNFYAVCQPKTGDVKNIETLLEKHPNKFVGLKFHPNGAELEADNCKYDAYIDLAQKKKLPCLFHSDRTFDTTYKWIENGTEKASTVKKTNFSRPEQIYSLAKRHPDVPFIMGHFGGPEIKDIDVALDVIVESAKNKDAKMYADISWVDIDNTTKPMDKITHIIKKFKNSPQGDLTDRILFGTDAPIDSFHRQDANLNYNNFVKGIYKTIKSNFKDDADTLIDKIFYKNAQNLFFSDNLGQHSETIISSNTTKNMSKTKAGVIFASAILISGAIAGYLTNKKNTNKVKK